MYIYIYIDQILFMYIGIVVSFVCSRKIFFFFFVEDENENGEEKKKQPATVVFNVISLLFFFFFFCCILSVVYSCREIMVDNYGGKC